MRAASLEAFALDPAHPDYARWKRAIDQAAARGGFVAGALALRMTLAGSRVLDLGCGMGGASLALRARDAAVVAADRDARRLRAVRQSDADMPLVCLDGARLPFDAGVFDAVVLQDVIEHVTDPAALLAESARVLRPGGVLYLSTPNRGSMLNMLADPHWGLPLAAVLRRPALRRMLRALRPKDADRGDLAQLLSLRALAALLASVGFAPRFILRHAVRRLFEDPRELVWSGSHLAAVAALRRLRLGTAIARAMRDEPGFIARAVVPTWYITAERR